MEQTLAIIKPDSVERRLVGNLISEIEKNDFTITAVKTLKLKKSEAESFYEIHRGQEFFERLVSFISSGPIFILRIRKKGAVSAWRELIGKTDPAAADPGSLRRQYGTSVLRNAVHGSDSTETARREIAFFFGDEE